MKKVVVTGGAGFIGSHVVETLLRQDYQVAVIDNFATGHRENIAGLPVDVHVFDVTDPDVMDLIVSLHPDSIVHLAAQISVAQSVRDPLFDEQVNIKGSLHVLRAAVRSSVKKIVFASSAAVYGSPISLPVTVGHPTCPESPYGLTKLTVERYLQTFYKLFGLPYAILRFSNVYGPRQDAGGEGGVVSIFSDCLNRDIPPFIFGDGKQTRDFIFVRDLASAVVKSLQTEKNLCVNISSGSSVTINQLFRMLRSISASKVNAIYKEARPGDIRESTLSNKEAKKLLNWEPVTDLFKGLQETLRFSNRTPASSN
ncbi:GDP-mannose 4,6-dehydratase [Sporolactobacillus sp. CQH2019]|uniref:NAD-dependent epimerase/dehydratase family protein n=1 Tax=Sporolactobacillus sp. CQH2019 TaxID=3023512 RepID=UPI0023675A9E|nr:NAD-dependent epimerase/dehydratase family protein [Sporolactobacillus sp. CQH2019]MDD9149042.1 GDP-mannose 4,6-dehydratase [Sporolactobacillus sp. CQH2019]